MYILTITQWLNVFNVISLVWIVLVPHPHPLSPLHIRLPTSTSASRFPMPPHCHLLATTASPASWYHLQIYLHKKCLILHFRYIDHVTYHTSTPSYLIFTLFSLYWSRNPSYIYPFHYHSRIHYVTYNTLSYMTYYNLPPPILSNILYFCILFLKWNIIN